MRRKSGKLQKLLDVYRKSKNFRCLGSKKFNSMKFTENDEIEEDVYEIENSKNISNNESEEEIEKNR